MIKSKMPEQATGADEIPGLRLVLAPNPSAMTGPGTNTYLLGKGDVAVIDPGPALPDHQSAILSALEPGERIACILVTHAHLDHSALVPALSAATGAPVLAFGCAEAGRSAAMRAWAERGGEGGGEGVDRAFAPDRLLADGETFSTGGVTLTALHTPGHFGNHICFQTGNTIFTGDIVMGWASTLISPPDGDVGDYRRSLARLAGLEARRLLPAHGAAIHHPSARISELLDHRQMREDALCATLKTGPQTLGTLVTAVYTDTPDALLPAARRNLLAHLVDLQTRGLARRTGNDIWHAA